MPRPFTVAIVTILSFSPLSLPAHALDHTAPAFDSVTLTGEAARLDDYRGKVVLIDFWATWCHPCARSLPKYEALQAKLGADQFVIITFCLDEDRENIESFAKMHELKLPVVHDKGGEVAGRYDPPSMPTAYLVDKQGQIRHVYKGYRNGDEKTVERDAKVLLAEGAVVKPEEKKPGAKENKDDKENKEEKEGKE